MTQHKSLAEAMVAFQANLPHVDKSSVNPHYRSNYAQLEDIVKIVLPALAKQGLAWLSVPKVTGDGRQVLVSRLMHAASGQVIESTFPIGGGNAQQRGSELTYAKRQALCAVTGVTPGGEDDDGNAASQPKQAPQEPAKLTTEQWQEWTHKVSKADSLDKLRALWGEAQKAGLLGHLNPAGRPLRAVLTVAKERLEGAHATPAEA